MAAFVFASDASGGLEPRILGLCVSWAIAAYKLEKDTPVRVASVTCFPRKPVSVAQGEQRALYELFSGVDGTLMSLLIVKVPPSFYVSLRLRRLARYLGAPFGQTRAGLLPSGFLHIKMLLTLRIVVSLSGGGRSTKMLTLCVANEPPRLLRQLSSRTFVLLTKCARMSACT